MGAALLRAVPLVAGPECRTSKSSLRCSIFNADAPLYDHSKPQKLIPTTCDHHCSLLGRRIVRALIVAATAIAVCTKLSASSAAGVLDKK